jgi:pilus assembly protein Flp/PilA
MGILLQHRSMARVRNRGQGLVEYALIIAFVVIVVVGSLVLLGPAIASIFGLVHTAL